MSTKRNTDRIQDFEQERFCLVEESERLTVISEAPNLTDDAIQTLFEELRTVRLRIYAIDLIFKGEQLE